MQIIKHWENILNLHNTETEKFLNENNVLGKEYRKSRKDRSEIGFNVFTLASDFYYRENFHSFILSAFLNPTDKHNEENSYLHLFIDLLNLKNNQKKIDKNDFLNSSVFVEKHKIDILITDDVSKKAIIIENKVNNAIDQFRQLPRYLEVVELNYSIESIVYLTLNSAKTPDKTDWTLSEKKSIDSKLKLIPVFDTNPKNINLFNHWILPAIIKSQNINSSSILRQYGELVKYLNTNTMDTISIKKFFVTINENNNLETAISIRNMLDNLPQYLAIRIEDKYKEQCAPFEKLWRYKDLDALFEGCKINNHNFRLDIWCSETGYVVYFWENEDLNFDIKEFCKTNNINAVSDFQVQNEISKLKKVFSPLDELGIFKLIDTLLNELRTLKSGIE